ncbi:RNA 2'-phosphotransferase [Oxynema aestuarii]|uniref:Probable RNA 2'-phosphotransferase n=1 Tax=Oxynema aestuarii AP17 TaxID=2064643 RepID=A0A6H1TYM3_9CYAN|nr:RNA 2'-phosphotransferase [Oxynema aestuarii]QIZ70863.1 RNA 2'-phosphotransferase [Oxynema aestuarii AP17]
MDNSRVTQISKYLSYHLRHKPEKIGLSIQLGGWVGVEELLSLAEKHGFLITREELEIVVKNNNKQRFSFDESGERIRANQGHSIAIDLQLTPQIPPDLLYHGTGDRFVASILAKGLLKMSRHHVHLSGDRETARQVGMRHGKPVIFSIDSAQMYRNSYQFYRSENGVWLVDAVPPIYLSQLP